MKDRFGREIKSLRLSVTAACNYRCVYCAGGEEPAPGVPRPLLSADELWELSAAAVRCGVKKIRLTGGEPLLRRDLPSLCERIAALDGLGELTLTTNGSLLRELAAPLRSAGVARLNISLDTLRPDRFRAITRLGTLDDVLDGLAAAEAAGFTRTKLNVVLMGGVNDDEIPDFVALTRDRSLSVRFIELMPTRVSAALPRERFLSADAVLRAAPELEPIGAEGVAELYRAPGHRGTVGLIRPMSRSFCADCDRIRITADGMLKPCLHSGAELSLRGLHGAALEEAIRAAVLEKPQRHLLAQDRPSGALRDMYEIGG